MFFSKHENFIAPKIQADQEFSTRNYASDFKHAASNFVKRDIEIMSNDLKLLGLTFHVPFIKTML